VELGIVKKSGAWFTYEGEQLGQGRENAKTFLAENIDLMLEISEKVRQEVGIDPSGAEIEGEGVDGGDGEIDLTAEAAALEIES
jgi:recombination protein RecA